MQFTTPIPSARHFRRRRLIRATLPPACVTIIAALALAACGSSSSSHRSSSTAVASTGASASSTGASSSASGLDLSAARAEIAPYTNHASAFPVSVPLPKALPKGTRFVYLQCGAPTCAVIGQLIAPAVAAIGGRLQVINAGTTAQTSQAAAASALALHPQVVLITGIDPSLFGGALKPIEAGGAKIVSFSLTMPNVQQYGITFNYVGEQALDTAGRLMADWVVVNKGAHANVVFYGVPEISFTPSVEAAFKAELAKNCRTCTVRFSSISIATAGTTSPQTIANDLQSHLSTNVAVVGASDIADGLPAALKATGISTTTLIYTPQPEQLEAIKSGGLSDGLAADFPTTIWTGVDIAARLLEGAPLTAAETAGDAPFEFLGKPQITFNPDEGWTGYPDFAQRFEKLWHPA